MVIRCPVCKADNTATTCRRCKADLTLLHTLEQQRQAALALARRALADHSPVEAQSAAALADQLRRDEESLQLLAVTALAAGDHAQAYRAYRLRRELG